MRQQQGWAELNDEGLSFELRVRENGRDTTLPGRVLLIRKKLPGSHTSRGKAFTRGMAR